MNTVYKDIFQDYNLPLETYFIDSSYKEYESHNNLEIIWVLKGNAKLTVEDEEHTMPSQSVFLVYHNQKHMLDAEKNAIIIAFRLKNEYLHRRGFFFEKLPYQGQVLTFEYLADKYRQVPLLIVQFLKLLTSNENKEMIYYKIIAYYNYYIEEIYNMFLKERYLDIKTQDYDDYLKRSQQIVDYIYNNYQNPLTLKDLQKNIHLSLSRLSHFIKESFGLSFQEFVQTVRFEHAIILLRTSRLSIYEIAKLSGFSDQKYLNKMMKKYINMTALHFRNKHKNITNKIRSLKHINKEFLKQLKECLRKLEKDPRFKTLFEIEPLYKCIY
jgi:YesN/AraC family two-component response regulator